MCVQHAELATRAIKSTERLLTALPFLLLLLACSALQWTCLGAPPPAAAPLQAPHAAKARSASCRTQQTAWASAAR